MGVVVTDRAPGEGTTAATASSDPKLDSLAKVSWALGLQPPSTLLPLL
jgi:hypothetical protein